MRLEEYETKELSSWHKLWYSNSYIFTTQCLRPLIFQTMNCIISINLSLKYKNFTESGCKEIGIQNFEVVAKTQFLYEWNPGVNIYFFKLFKICKMQINT